MRRRLLQQIGAVGSKLAGAINYHSVFLAKLLAVKKIDLLRVAVDSSFKSRRIPATIAR
jgi:hypothetical protein